MKPHSLDKLSSVRSVYSHLNKTGPSPMLVERNKMFISVMSLMLSGSDEDVDVTLVWDWLLHYTKCSRELCVHPMKKNRMTDNMIFVSFGGALDNVKPNFTDIQE